MMSKAVGGVWSWRRVRDGIARRAVELRTRAARPWQGRTWSLDQDVSLAVPLGFDLESVPAPTRGIAVVCHIFYADMAHDLSTLFANIPFPADLFLSTDTECKRGMIHDAFSDWPAGHVDVRLSPNRGRDIAPKYVTFADIYPKYDLVLFVHGKKSLEAAGNGGDEWRSLLYETLVGSADIVRSIVAVFAQRPDIGIVAPQHHSLIRHLIHWDGNFGEARRLARRFHVRLSRRQPVDFAAGSMFWARPAALRPLLDLNLAYKDFPPERGQLHRTIQHAIERLMFVVTEHAGYNWVKVAVPARYPGDASVVSVGSPAALDDFLARTRRQVLP